MSCQKAVGRDAQRGVMVETAPVAAFVIRQTELLFEFPVVPLDAPAHLGCEDQLLQGGIGGRGGQPVAARFLIACGPLDQQPFFGAHRRGRTGLVRRADAQAGETGRQRRIGAIGVIRDAPRYFLND